MVTHRSVPKAENLMGDNTRSHDSLASGYLEFVVLVVLINIKSSLLEQPNTPTL